MAKTLSGVDPAAFKTTFNGKIIDLYVLKNSAGAEVSISNYGSTIISFVVPDKTGKPTDIVLGQPNIDSYTSHTTYLGSTIGRYSNRIANGKFVIDDRESTLPMNNGPVTLHSADTGFHNQAWTVVRSSPDSLLLAYAAADGEGGFPGTLQTVVRWTLTDDNSLVMETTATTDAPTVVSITNHAFFNLDGGDREVTETLLQINGDWYLPVGADKIPLGAVAPVAGTPFDFRSPTPIGARIDDPDDGQIKIGTGYDVNFVLKKKVAGELVTAAVAHSENSGITLEVKSTLPGIQFYSGNRLFGLPGKLDGQFSNRRFAFCLEPQYFPDSPNQGHFPAVILRPGQGYHEVIVFKASAQ
jgi:aldose 1-epimerase